MSENTSSIDQFLYRPELIEAGMVYHYIKSNIDGSYPARIFIYVSDHDHLKVLKLEEHGMDAALVRAHMDGVTFSADQFTSWWLTADGKRMPQASLSSSYADRTYTISWQDRNEVVHVTHYPVHVYNFDLISLNFSLRHWKDPEGELNVGILQPNFDPNPETMLKYEGRVVIQFLGEDEHNEQRCRKYSIGGEGLKGCQGLMWVNKEKGYIEDIEIPVADHPDWDTFKFKFIFSKPMDLEQWAALIDTEIKKLKTK
jgi:hypothetical protein